MKVNDSWRQEIWLVIALTGVGLILNWLWYGMPWLILVPIMIAYLIDSPVGYLAGLGLIGEVFSLSWPGIAILVALCPWLIKTVLRGQVDVSLRYWLILTGTALVQSVSFFIPDIWRTLMRAEETSVVFGLPWKMLGSSVVLISTLSFTVVVLIYFNRRHV